MTVSMPSWPAIRRAVASLSPLSMTTATPSSCSASTACAEVSRAASARPMTPAGRPSTATSTAVRPLAASSSRRARMEPASTPSRTISWRLPTTTLRPPTSATAPCPGTLRKVDGAAGSTPCCAAYRTMAPASGCSDSCSTEATRVRSSVSSMPSVRTSVTSGSPLVSVPVLSMTTVSMRAACLQRSGVLDEHTALGAETRADHDRRRRGQAQRVGAGDHHDRDGEEQRGLHTRPRPEPDEEGADAAHQGDQHEPEGGTVGEPLPGRLGVLRLLDQGDDLGQCGVRADLGGPDPQRAGGVDGGADDLRPRCLGHRKALARDHRLVDLGDAVLDDAVDRNLRRRAG